MLSSVLADCVIFVHLAYVAFAVVGLALVLVGLALRWQWVRNLRFRVIHLVMVEVVALEGWFNIRCPLTDVEDVLRSQDSGSSALKAPVERNAILPVAAVADNADWQPVFQQAEPEAAPQPNQAPAADEQPAAEAPNTFVGRLLGAVLYVHVEQATLDNYYVGFGLVTLAVFVAFPPRRGAWTRPGFCGLVLIWIGSLFFTATLYDWLVGHSMATLYPALVFDNAYPPLVTGAAMTFLGIGCGLMARRRLETRISQPDAE